MQERAKRRKRAVNLSIDADLVAEAKAAGVNLSETLERALTNKLRETRKRKWQEENRKATESMNEYVRKHGLWSDKYRTW
jgi:antitoxin CcdA